MMAILFLPGLLRVSTVPGDCEESVEVACHLSVVWCVVTTFRKRTVHCELVLLRTGTTGKYLATRTYIY